MATGHMLGDTGDYSNTIYTGFEVDTRRATRPQLRTVTPFLESDPVLAQMDEHFAGNYLDEATILKLAHDKGYSTAAIGKTRADPDVRSHQRSGGQTIIVDDADRPGPRASLCRRR